MKKVTFLTAIVVVLFFVPLNTFASVIINEIAWMGTDVSVNDEWIELYNNSDQQIDLTSWILEASDGTPKINLTGTISAKGYFLLERTDDTTVPAITADQIYTGVLSNSGENLKLKNNNGNVVDNVINCDAGWCAGDNTTKQTMEKATTGWQTSLNPSGTPKAQNSSGAIEEPEQEGPAEQPEIPLIPTGNNPPIADAGNNIIGFINQEINFDASNSSDPDKDELAYSWNMGDGKLIEEPSFTYKYLFPGTYLVSLMVYDGRNYVSDTITVKIQSQEIIINEFIPNPEGRDEENEWIEIYNDSDSIVDISGWQLDDMDSGGKPFIFPQNTLIAPKNYLVFSRIITNIALNNTSDSVRLLLPEGIVFQEIVYENCKEGQSSARTDEGFVWSVPTPGMANIISPPQSVGGPERETVYRGQTKIETTKESSQDYSWYYKEPEQEIESGYAPPSLAETTENKENKLAGAFPLIEQQGEVKGSQKEISSRENFWNQNNINLILMIVVVMLASLVIGLFLTKFRKKFP